MTKLQKQKLIAELQAFLLSRGFTCDRYGNYLKDTYRTSVDFSGIQHEEKDTCRYVFQDNTLRREAKVYYSDGTTGWIRVSSGFYSKLRLSPDKNGKTSIFGMVR